MNSLKEDLDFIYGVMVQRVHNRTMYQCSEEWKVIKKIIKIRHNEKLIRDYHERLANEADENNEDDEVPEDTDTDTDTESEYDEVENCCNCKELNLSAKLSTDMICCSTCDPEN